MTPKLEAELYDGLRRITDRCAEALASLHADKKVDQQHFDNVLDINREVWSLRWELGLSGGQQRPTPAPFEGQLSTGERDEVPS
jgi:hypothetical protein